MMRRPRRRLNETHDAAAPRGRAIRSAKWMIGDLASEAVDAMIEACPGDPREVAELVTRLCSDASVVNTGAIFDMSGGRARY